ncbi:hypothetical protein ACLB1E_37210 [Escherichia coli]
MGYFDNTPQDIDLLEHAHVAASAHAPFLSSIAARDAIHEFF